MTLRENILHRLEDSGYRLTGSRLQLLDTLLTHVEGFTAEELVSEAQGAPSSESASLRGREPSGRIGRTGRATVYRTIRLLVDQGVLCKLAMDSGAPRYTLSGMAHHHHLVCVACGGVREFRETVIERALRHLEEDGDEIVGHRIEVYVLCPTCNAAGTKVNSIKAQHSEHPP